MTCPDTCPEISSDDNIKTTDATSLGIASFLSAIVAVTVAVNALPSSPSASAVEVCLGDDVIISATGSGSGDLVFYDDTQTEVGRVTMSAVNPTGTYNAGALVTGTYVYYVSEDDGSCVSNLQAVGITVNALPASPVVAGVTICAGDAAVLTASSSVNWYADAGLTNLLSTGSIYTTSALTLTTDYYVTQIDANGCESASRRAAMFTPSPSKLPSF